jgi:Glyoxalase-like domain
VSDRVRTIEAVRLKAPRTAGPTTRTGMRSGDQTAHRDRTARTSATSRMARRAIVSRLVARLTSASWLLVMLPGRVHAVPVHLGCGPAELLGYPLHRVVHGTMCDLLGVPRCRSYGRSGRLKYSGPRRPPSATGAGQTTGTECPQTPGQRYESRRRASQRRRQTSPMTVSLHHIVIDAHDLPRLARFWSEVLGWKILSEHEREVVIGAEVDASVGICLMPAGDQKSVKNRVHLDLNPGCRRRR